MQRSWWRFCIGAKGKSSKRAESCVSEQAPDSPESFRGNDSVKLQRRSLLFVRFAERISCASLPRDRAFLFVLAFSEHPRIVFYQPGICKLRSDVTACIQRCADIRVEKNEPDKSWQWKIGEQSFLPVPTFERNFMRHCILKWTRVWTNYLYYSSSQTWGSVAGE